MTELGGSQIAAVWSEKGQVDIYDLQRPLVALSDSQAMAAFLREEQAKIKPVFSFAGHMTEGFAMDWSPKKPGNQLGWNGNGVGRAGNVGTGDLDRQDRNSE